MNGMDNFDDLMGNIDKHLITGYLREQKQYLEIMESVLGERHQAIENHIKDFVPEPEYHTQRAVDYLH